MEKRWVRTAMAWLAFFVVGFAVWRATEWAPLATFWGIAAHFAVSTLLSTEGDRPANRLGLIAVVGVVGVGTLAVTTERWGSHEWPTVTFALFFGWLAYEIGGRLLTPKMIRARLDRMRGDLGTDRWSQAEAPDILSRKVPETHPPVDGDEL